MNSLEIKLLWKTSTKKALEQTRQSKWGQRGNEIYLIYRFSNDTVRNDLKAVRHFRNVIEQAKLKKEGCPTSKVIVAYRVVRNLDFCRRLKKLY